MTEQGKTKVYATLVPYIIFQVSIYVSHNEQKVEMET